MIIEDTRDFGIWVRTTRKNYGISQEYISRDTGLTRANISKIENNKSPNFKFKNAIKIANSINGVVVIKDHKELNQDV